MLDNRTPLIVSNDEDIMGMAATRVRIVKPGGGTAGMSLGGTVVVVSVVVDIVDDG
jgi:hypothetical protein